MFTASAGIVIRHWPPEAHAVAYVPALRTTHLISEAGARLLHKLAGRPLSLQDLAEDWSGGELVHRAALMASLSQALTGLESAELISSSR